jgi:flagellar operon protein
MTNNRIYYPQQPLRPINNPINTSNSQQIAKPGTTNIPSFNSLLEQELTGVKFSQHAQQRLQSRNIKLNQAELTKLNDAVDKAAQKGAKESLVLMDNNLALVVSVKNKTVITAMDGASMKDNVFTNIDSAVII